MKDAEFKSLNHCCNNYEIYSQGKEIEKNYSPDFVLKLQNDFILIEHETEPNRKTIIADIFKAGHFLQNQRNGILVIVMTPKKPSSFKSYTVHVLEYYRWIKSKTNLRDVFFVHQLEYYKNGIILKINDSNFIKNAISLNSLL